MAKAWMHFASMHLLSKIYHETTWTQINISLLFICRQKSNEYKCKLRDSSLIWSDVKHSLKTAHPWIAIISPMQFTIIRGVVHIFLIFWKQNWHVTGSKMFGAWLATLGWYFWLKHETSISNDIRKHFWKRLFLRRKIYFPKSKFLITNNFSF